MIELFTMVLSSVFYFTLSCTLAASSDVSNAFNNSIIIQLRHVVEGIKINVNIKTQNISLQMHYLDPEL